MRIITASEHQLSPNNFSVAALQVIKRLQHAGFQAYLVGGGVRDSLLGLPPKDFDVATNATPEQIKPLFCKAFIIGRRFRIVHVRNGQEIIEVTTFRGHHAPEEDASNAQQSANGLLLRDNVWGNIEDDAYRRDFTINALYYNTLNETVHDWTEGFVDLQARRLRLIGEPLIRYREDPVRMLRAARFAAKLNFILEETTAAPIFELAPLLLSISPARLYDESLKIFLGGHALQSYRNLRYFGLFAMLFTPTFDAYSVVPWGETLVEQALINTDRRLQTNQTVTPIFIFAALLWPAVKMELQTLRENGMSPLLSQQQAGMRVLSRQLRQLAIPKRFTLPMREIWEMQLRLTRRQNKRTEQLLAQPRFRAAYDFLLLREQAGEIPAGLGQWWTDYQARDKAERQQMVDELQSQDINQPKKRTRKQQSSKRN